MKLCHRWALLSTWQLARETPSHFEGKDAVQSESSWCSGCREFDNNASALPAENSECIFNSCHLVCVASGNGSSFWKLLSPSDSANELWGHGGASHLCFRTNEPRAWFSHSDRICPPISSKKHYSTSQQPWRWACCLFVVLYCGFNEVIRFARHVDVFIVVAQAPAVALMWILNTGKFSRQLVEPLRRLVS